MEELDAAHPELPKFGQPKKGAETKNGPRRGRKADREQPNEPQRSRSGRQQRSVTPSRRTARSATPPEDASDDWCDITESDMALIFVSLSDLTQDQRQVLTSLMSHRDHVLADYRLAELCEIHLEIFCTTKTTVDNPLFAFWSWWPQDVPGD